jgi:protein-S-isoprenylcysteine O-methyltransferase Ste14
MLVALFVVTTVAFLLLVNALRLPDTLSVARHLALWLLWAGWVAWIFPRARASVLLRWHAGAYRQAFWTNILPGVSFGVAQMLAPSYELAIHGTVRLDWGRVAFSALSITAGLFMLWAGVRAIGVAAAGFFYEYGDQAPVLSRRGIYGYVRHPLFAGGVVISLAPVGVASDEIVGLLALGNLFVLCVYRWAEDRRMAETFGVTYLAYRRSVPAFVPLGLVFAKGPVGIRAFVHRARAALPMVGRPASMIAQGRSTLAWFLVERGRRG